MDIVFVCLICTTCFMLGMILAAYIIKRDSREFDYLTTLLICKRVIEELAKREGLLEPGLRQELMRMVSRIDGVLEK